MHVPILSTVLALGALATLSFSLSATQKDGEAAMQEMMKQSERWTKPGEHHKALEKFVGTWNTEIRAFMGETGVPAGKGTAEYSWMMPGRWLQGRSKATLMGRPLDTFYVFGYDNFKMSYVVTGVSSFDTAMNRCEGDMTPDGKALIAYGMMDEYLTGEHDKMVKYAWRFIDADTIVEEISDLPIGEVNNKVLEIKYTRAK